MTLRRLARARAEKPKPEDKPAAEPGTDRSAKYSFSPEVSSRAESVFAESETIYVVRDFGPYAKPFLDLITETNILERFPVRNIKERPAYRIKRSRRADAYGGTISGLDARLIRGNNNTPHDVADNLLG